MKQRMPSRIRVKPPRTSEPPVDPARSAQMARVKGKDTKPEMIVRRALHAAGLRYRLHDKKLPGRPDVVFPARRVAVQVRGCFWHQDPNPACRLARLPKSRLEFWVPKLRGNAERDRRDDDAMADMGWKVIVVWECEVRDAARLAAVVDEVRASPVRWRERRPPVMVAA